MRKLKDKSLRDQIRVNLRRVIAEGKSFEKKENDQRLGMEKLEKEARYDSVEYVVLWVVY